MATQPFVDLEKIEDQKPQVLSLREQIGTFLSDFSPDGHIHPYRAQLEGLGATGSHSLVIDFGDLESFNNDLAVALLQEPDNLISDFKDEVKEAMSGRGDIKKTNIRFKRLTQTLALREVNVGLLDKMFSIAGMINRVSERKNIMVNAAFVCPDGHTTYVMQDTEDLKKPVACCGGDCKFLGNSLELDQKDSDFLDYQMVRIQELPEELPAGQLPRGFDINLTDDMIDVVRPGDHALITGILRAVKEHGIGSAKRRIFDSEIDCNFAEVKEKDAGAADVTPEDVAAIKEIASKPDAYGRLVHSMVPAVMGHDDVKEATLLQLVGGVQITLPDESKRRGDFHILLAGDPGVAKSEMLKFAAHAAARSVLANGRATSAAGLGAGIVKHNDIPMLEVGVLPLADQGLACMTPDAEIYTGDSLLKVSDIWENALPYNVSADGKIESRTIWLSVQSYANTLRKDSRGIATKIIRKPYSGKIIELTLGSGLVLKLTPEHLIRRPTVQRTKWIEAGKLKADDLIKSPKTIFGPSVMLDLSPDWCYLIGMIYGDGYVTPTSTTISQAQSNNDIIDNVMAKSPIKFARYVKTPKVKIVKGYTLIERDVHLWTSNKELLRIYNYMMKPSIDSVLQLDDDSLAAFLAGVFDSDGDVNHAHGQITSVRFYPTYDAHALAVLLHALKRFSIVGRIRRGEKKSGLSYKEDIPIIQIAGDDITRFFNLIKPHSVKVGREKTLTIKHKTREDKQNTDRIISVREIEYDGFVYDLTVPSYNNFTNSLVYIHNCIDELDKMKAEDRSALHEAMEQQTISYNKAGFHVTLNTRVSVLAACNPIMGIYNPNISITENINIVPSLLSRFDLIFIIRDIPGDGDKSMAQYILSTHMNSEYASPPPVPFILLKKYIAYARANVKPKMTQEASNKIEEYFLQLRKLWEPGKIPVTPRTIEALIRLSTARAKILLKPEVTAEDAEQAISLMQRMVQDVLVDPNTKQADFGQMVGMSQQQISKSQAMMDVLKQVRIGGGVIDKRDFKDELKKTGKFDDEGAEKAIRQLYQSGRIYELRAGVFRVISG